MTRTTPQAPSDPGAFLRALRDPGSNLREKYRPEPVELAERFGLMLPRKPVQVMQELGIYDEDTHGPVTPGLRDMVYEVCHREILDAAAVGPRGGGKSFGVAFIEFFLVFLHDFDALNLGGSELQADNVYQYLLGFIENDKFWESLLKSEPQREKTFTVEDAWIRVLTASQKSVRSPHAGGIRKGKERGGLLVIDEEAETEENIVKAALGTINTGRPSVNVRCSTFHNLGGSFQELIDNHSEMGYKLYRWDIFDVCEGCDCVGDGCQSEESCFRDDHHEDYINPDTGETESRLIHKAYCGGRAKYAEGWIPMREVLAMWRRGKRDHATWEVEAMGSRPTSKGYVIKDHTKYSENLVSESGESLYIAGFPVTVCVDWGTIAAGVEVWQERRNDVHVLLHAEQVEEAGETEIISKVVGLGRKYLSDLTEIAADIGGGGNYLNPKLRNEFHMPVRDVNFQEEKEAAVAAWNVYNEAGKTVIPEEFDKLHEQVRKWKRKNGRIQKGNDHLCDTAVCYFAKFVDRLSLTHLRGVSAKSFSTSSGEDRDTTGEWKKPTRPRNNRVAIIRTFGAGRR